MRLYEDDALVDALTREVMATGARIFQIHKFGANEAAHVDRLLAVFHPARGAHVVDAGCGVGGVARLMAERRPDLTWTLVNISRSQLALCPPDMKHIEASIEAIPLPAASADGVMICYAMGHVAHGSAMRETARLLRPGGVLLIYDLCTGDPKALGETLGYSPPSIIDILDTAKSAGFRVTHIETPQDTSTADFMRLTPSPEAVAALHDALPVLFRFERL